MKNIKALGVRIDNLSEEELRVKFIEILKGNKFCQIATINPEFLVNANNNKNFKDLLNHTELNICDGIGIVFWKRILYGEKIHRIAGVRVAEILCEVSAEMNKSIFFLGGYKVANIAAKKMRKKIKNLKIAGTLDGDENSFDEINKKNPDAILVAFGSPKQELWLSNKAPKILSLKIGIGIGGTFDFWSNKVLRAPIWMQKTGLEWFYRLIKQPSRWKRIYKAIIVFSRLMIKEKIK